MTSTGDTLGGEMPGAEIDQNIQKPLSVVETVVMDTYEYEGVPLPKSITPKDMAAIKAMEIREDDIILVTFPKCGTHWMIEIILLLMNGGEAASSKQRKDFATALLELRIPGNASLLGDKAGFEVLADKPSPRVIISHLPLQFLPDQIWTKKPRVIYVSRHPRDSLTSSFNFFCADPRPPPFDTLLQAFLSEKLTFGSCWAHQFAFWEHRNDDNVMFVRFEDMKKDPAGIVAKVAAHINIKLTEEQMNNTVKYSALPEMKASYARVEEELGPEGKLITHAGGVLPFLHKGTVGGWRALFSEAQAEVFHKHHEEQVKKYGVDIW